VAYIYNVTVGSSSRTTTWPLNLNSTYTTPLTVYTGGGSGLPAPRPKTALDWLDDEIEAVCKLARQAA
jgi:hypothetical protein